MSGRSVEATGKSTPDGVPMEVAMRGFPPKVKPEPKKAKAKAEPEAEPEAKVETE